MKRVIFTAASPALAPLTLLRPLARALAYPSERSLFDLPRPGTREGPGAVAGGGVLPGRGVTQRTPFSLGQASEAGCFLDACVNFPEGPDFWRCRNLSEQLHCWALDL